MERQFGSGKDVMNKQALYTKVGRKTQKILTQKVVAKSPRQNHNTATPYTKLFQFKSFQTYCQPSELNQETFTKTNKN